MNIGIIYFILKTLTLEGADFVIAPNQNTRDTVLPHHDTFLPYNQTNIMIHKLDDDLKLWNIIRSSGFRVVLSSPNRVFTAFPMHSVRSGSADRLDGVSSYCDWYNPKQH